MSQEFSAGTPAAGVTGTADPFLTAVRALSGHRAVAAVSDTEIDYGDKDDPDQSRLIGIIGNAVAEGGTVQVKTSRSMTEPSWNWIAGLPIYLGDDGMLTQDPPPTGYVKELGVATAPQTIWINIAPAIELAN